MRRSTTVRGGIAVAVILVIGLGGLVACTGSGGTTPPTPSGSAASTVAPTASATTTPPDPAADAAALAKVQVTGDAGKAATVALPSKPFTVTSDVSQVLAAGTGDTLASGELLKLHSSWFSGADGSSLGSTYDKGTPESLVLSPTDLPATLIQSLTGAKVGVRVLVALTGTSGTSVAVVDVVSAAPVPARAQGTAVTAPAGLPAVTLDATGKPSLVGATGTAPTTLVAQPLIQGTGPAVVSGQTIVVKYTGWLWNGTQFDSSWDRGETFSVPSIGTGQVIDGWNQGLVGVKVGSQVLLVVPPDKGYGATAQGSIPANSTLVFVVDVLAAG